MKCRDMTLKTNREGTVSARKSFVRPRDEDERVSRMISPRPLFLIRRGLVDCPKAVTRIGRSRGAGVLRMRQAPGDNEAQVPPWDWQVRIDRRPGIMRYPAAPSLAILEIFRWAEHLCQLEDCRTEGTEIREHATLRWPSATVYCTHGSSTR